MTIKAIIVDDERNAREALDKLIRQYCPTVEVLGLAESANAAFDMIQQHQPDLVFLDIQMPENSGFELLQRFAEIDFQVIFTTAHSQYATKAFRFAALDYLLKPIDVEELQDAVSRVGKDAGPPIGTQQILELMNLLQHKQHTLGLADSKGITFVNVKDIIRCEADRNYTYIYLADNTKHTQTKTMKEFESLLTDHNFMRVHKSHLINLAYVQRYQRIDGGFIIMQDGSQIEISSRRKTALLERLSKM